MKQPEITAIKAADLHLSHEPPSARAVAGVDWYEVQAGYLDQLRKIASKKTFGTGEVQDLPVIVAGDIFDDGWRPHRCPPSLINLAINHLPHIYCVPGQHDLPHHRLDKIRDSALWTLKEAGKATILQPGKPVEVPGKHPLRLHGFPWGVPVQELKDPCDLVMEIAVVHAYVWVKGKGHSGADPRARFKNLKESVRGFDGLVIGDNHTPWDIKSGGKGFPFAFNCGGFMRRRSDEVNHRPRVGLLKSDGTVDSHYLDVSGDKFADADTVVESPKNTESMDEFLAELKGISDRVLDFREAVLRWMDRDKVGDGVRDKVLKSLDGKKR